MKLERDCVVDDLETDSRPSGETTKRLNVEWTESEWFRIYLQLARKENPGDSD